MMDAEKPHADILRKRFSEDGRRHGLFGKTARRITDADSRQRLKAAQLSKVHVNSVPSNKLLWTALEVGGFDASHSLDRRLAWNHIPELLSEHAIEAPLVKNNPDGSIETTFILEPVVEELVNNTRQRSQKATDGKLYVLRPHARSRPALFAVPPTEPPAEVVECRHSALLMPSRMGGVGGRSGLPLARSRAAFDVTSAGGVGGTKCKLDIDLGEDCEVTHISTQGRHPQTRVFPHVRRERLSLVSDVRGRAYSLGLGRRAARTSRRDAVAGEAVDRCVEGYSVEGHARWRLETHGVYDGPWYDVLDLHPDKEQCSSTGRLYQPHERYLQWVAKYEVYYRQDSGRTWLPLGPFRGNTDAVSEVAHDVRGLRARHLRFIPTEVEGGGAMRVGIYGRRTTAVGCSAGASGAIASAAHGQRRHAEAADDEELALVKYTLRTCPDKVNARYTHRRSYSRCRCSWCLGDLASRSRMRFQRKMGAWCEAAGNCVERYASDGGSDCEDDSDGTLLQISYADEKATALGAAVALATQEREELQLALALSLSLVEVAPPPHKVESGSECDELETGHSSPLAVSRSISIADSEEWHSESSGCGTWASHAFAARSSSDLSDGECWQLVEY